jgi:hypothetical protein
MFQSLYNLINVHTKKSQAPSNSSHDWFSQKITSHEKPTMNEQEKCVLGVFRLVQFQSFMKNIFTTNITLIQCNNIMMIIAKLKDIVFYQVTFWFQAPN